ncbi:hypothetical protein BC936DRAFT_137558 [Jimgerdemannia flammicorona]|uniref:MACPF domain-containing protein n=1 Tax=Jimgerdemannia flammicorona TaxID=994334 RepID=A0A433CX39_9FUNG|nr:hypothetical protein BC936DRAFT_137558 [Jimgerdemannia flammicorona]
MADDSSKQIAIGVTDLLKLYDIFNKRNRQPLVTSDLQGIPDLRLRDFLVCNSTYLLPPFATETVMNKSTTNILAQQHTVDKSSEYGAKLRTNMAELQASQETAIRNNLNTTVEAEKIVSYKLEIINGEVDHVTALFWGPNFQTLWKSLNCGQEPMPTYEQLLRLFTTFGTHFVSGVEVGYKRESFSEHHQVNEITNRTAAVLTPLPHANLHLNIKNGSNAGRSDDKNNVNTQGSQSQPTVLLKFADPLWTLQPVNNRSEDMASKLKLSFFHRVDKGRDGWHSTDSYGNFNYEPGVLARIPSSTKEVILLVDDDRLKVTREGTVLAFKCKVYRTLRNVRFQFWKQVAKGKYNTREYEKMWEKAFDLVKGNEEYPIDGTGNQLPMPLIKPNYVVGIAIPLTDQGRRLQYPIICQPKGSKNAQSCWILGKKDSDRCIFKGVALKEYGGLFRSRVLSVPFIGFSIKASDIEYYKHILRDDLSGEYQVTYDDEYFDGVRRLIKGDPSHLMDNIQKRDETYLMSGIRNREEKISNMTKDEIRGQIQKLNREEISKEIERKHAEEISNKMDVEIAKNEIKVDSEEKAIINRMAKQFAYLMTFMPTTI